MLQKITESWENELLSRLACLALCNGDLDIIKKVDFYEYKILNSFGRELGKY